MVGADTTYAPTLILQLVRGQEKIGSGVYSESYVVLNIAIDINKAPVQGLKNIRGTNDLAFVTQCTKTQSMNFYKIQSDDNTIQ